MPDADPSPQVPEPDPPPQVPDPEPPPCGPTPELPDTASGPAPVPLSPRLRLELAQIALEQAPVALLVVEDLDHHVVGE